MEQTENTPRTPEQAPSPTDLVSRFQQLDSQIALAREANETHLAKMVGDWAASGHDKIPVSLIGDVQPPSTPVDFEPFGVTVRPDQGDTGDSGVLPSVRAYVRMNSMDEAGLREAWLRLGEFCSADALVSGGIALRPFSPLSAQGVRPGHVFPLDCPYHRRTRHIAEALSAWDRLEANRGPDHQVGPRIRAALYWLSHAQEPVHLLFRDDALAVYMGYWNAFECLIEAVNLQCPMGEPTEECDREKLYHELIDKKGATDTAIRQCYAILRPPLREKGEHALRSCFPEAPFKACMEQCFNGQPKEDQLYQIRNGIAHGTLRGYDLEERDRVEQRSHYLREIVVGMLRWILDIPPSQVATAPPLETA